MKEALQSLYAGLKLRINEEKSAVARVWTRKLLGYGFWVDSKKGVRRRVAKKAFEEFRKLGASRRVAAKAAFRIDQWWRSGALAIHMVLTEHYFDQLGVPKLGLK